MDTRANENIYDQPKLLFSGNEKPQSILADTLGRGWSGFFQGLLDQGEDELFLGDLPALTLGLCGDVGLELLGSIPNSV